MRGESADYLTCRPYYYAALQLTKKSTIHRETRLLSSHIVAKSLTAVGVSNVEGLRSVIVWLCQYASCLLRNLQQAAISSVRDNASFAADRAGNVHVKHASEQLTYMLNIGLVITYKRLYVFIGSR